MILKLSKSGNDTSEMCRATIPVPYGAFGVQLLSIDLPDNAGEFSPEFITGISVNGNVIDVAAQGSLEDLVDYLNGIDAPNRALFVYLHDNEWGVCPRFFSRVRFVPKSVVRESRRQRLRERYTPPGENEPCIRICCEMRWPDSRGVRRQIHRSNRVCCQT